VRLFVGLGNPGSDFAKNRHNIGFMAVDEIVHRHSFAPFRSKFQGQLSEGKIAGQKVLILKPTTYMNESGKAVQAAMAFYKLALQDIIVFQDEMDLVAGKIRMKTGGGHAGHNGIRSIQSHIGSGFQRVRLGVGHPGDKEKVVGHVLKDFSKADQQWLDKMIEAIGENADLLIKGEDSGFMSKVSLALNPPQLKPPRDLQKDTKNKKEEQ
jgi:peptidyl-tRNA hydrolase, PTH1 family